MNLNKHFKFFFYSQQLRLQESLVHWITISVFLINFTYYHLMLKCWQLSYLLFRTNLKKKQKFLLTKREVSLRQSYIWRRTYYCDSLYLQKKLFYLHNKNIDYLKIHLQTYHKLYLDKRLYFQHRCAEVQSHLPFNKENTFMTSFTI